ncbi:MAG: septal ring lytic transglycosylase RlpA family lipoprotein [Deltaproteobacteria bacterium]|nr:MAG: septal ring lytic transglycosylase RlpA family lipoprotein [Deltaproteobacteria bacterium]
MFILVLSLSACGTPTYKTRVLDTPSQPDLKPTQRPYEVNGERYQPIPSADGFVQKGLASWYGKKFHGRKTSNGETYDMYAMTAAHKTLPMNVYLKVTNLDNGRSTVVRVNDRGPFVRSRIIDLSYTAANELGVVGPGTAPVRIEALGYRDDAQSGTTPHYTQLASYDVGPFMVQVGAFTVKENAYRLAEKLKSQYGSSAVVEGWVNGQKFYRVRVGLYPSMALATDGLLQIETNGYPRGFIVAR